MTDTKMQSTPAMNTSSEPRDAGVASKLLHSITHHPHSTTGAVGAENCAVCLGAIAAATEAAVKGRDDWWVARLTAAGFHPGLSLEENVDDLTARLEEELGLLTDRPESPTL